MNLQRTRDELGPIAQALNWDNRILYKFLKCYNELGEAGNAYERNEHAHEEIAEELIDVIISVLDLSRLACSTIDMDQIFNRKLDDLRWRARLHAPLRGRPP